MAQVDPPPSTTTPTPEPSSSNPVKTLRGNPSSSEHPNAPWVIQKYGGTSVGRFIDNIAGEIVPSFLDSTTSQPVRIALVCSARSGVSKSTGTTNLLLQAALEALRPVPSPSTSRPTTPAAVGNLINPLTSNQTLKNVNGGGSVVNRRECSRSESNSPSPSRRQTSNSVSSLSMSSSIASLTSVPSPSTNGNNTPNGHRNSNGAGQGQSVSGFDETVEKIKEDHLKAAREAVRDDRELLAELEDDIEFDCERLRRLLLAAQIIEEISPRSKDIIIGYGERLSCRIVTAALRDRGIDAELVLLDDLIEKEDLDSADIHPSSSSSFSSSSLGQPFYDMVAMRLGDRLRECEDRVPVVTGFFGVVPGSLLSQIGRGYTDLCAALCAVGVSSSELQIWKEVDGIFTADPRKVPTARLLPIITPDEAAELTYYGSEVIHPFTMDQVIRHGIPIRIKNVENPKGGGTVIYPNRDPSSSGGGAGGAVRSSGVNGYGTPPSTPILESSEGGNSTPPSMSASGTISPRSDSFSSRPKPAFFHLNGYNTTNSSSAAGGGGGVGNSMKSRRIPTAVTFKDSIIVINVHSNRKTISHGFFARIFGTLDKHGIVVDLISTSEVYVSMAMNGNGIRKGILDRLVGELGDVGEVTVKRDMAILSLVGHQMRNMVGIAGKMFSTLAEGNVNIEMISQGASEINISCVIEGRDAVKALNLVHHNLLSLAAPLANNHAGPWFF